MLTLSCDGCHCRLDTKDAHGAGRIEPVVLCSTCHEKHVALQTVLDAKQAEVAALYETFQREQREASGLKAVPDA